MMGEVETPGIRPSATTGVCMETTKKNHGQFYTTRVHYILEGLPVPSLEKCRCLIEPFAGKGDLLQWWRETGVMLRESGTTPALPIEAYDIDPKTLPCILRDTLEHPPDYTDAFILTNPPYLARNKSKDKHLYDRYATNDLYKCFIWSVLQSPRPCRGGIWILPAGFFLSPRDIDARCRDAFLRTYKVLAVKYFDEPVFDDTDTTVVAVAFEYTGLTYDAQEIPWTHRPSGETRTFRLAAETKWIIGGDIYALPGAPGVSIRRHVVGRDLLEGEQLTHMTLNALDSGVQGGSRIGLTYQPGVVYPGKETSRTYATLCIRGVALTPDDQRRLCEAFNAFVEQKRTASWSLFLPTFRESKDYARKRMPFELAYGILSHLIGVKNAL